MRRAFTLIEMLVVISIILVLFGMLMVVSKRSGLKTSARTQVAIVAAAINSYGPKSFELWPDGASAAVVSRAWDVNGDTILDGIIEPAKYWRKPPPAADAATLDRLRYKGFVATTAMPGLRGIRESDLVLMDPWDRPLRITWALRIYGDDGFCVWSQGPDVNKTSDDILSRESR